jgi:type IV pilus assembly protein PilA
MEMRDNKGFSLIELLIVVAIILIIAAIAIPNLLRARIAANEASAAQSVRQINTAEFAYNAAYPNVGYASDLASLGGSPPCLPSSTTACLLDNTLSSATPGKNSKSGYVFLATGIAASGTFNNSFLTGASPLTFGVTGVRDFCSTEDGVIRFDPGKTGATPVTKVSDCQLFTMMQ